MFLDIFDAVPVPETTRNRHWATSSIENFVGTPGRSGGPEFEKSL